MLLVWSCRLPKSWFNYDRRQTLWLMVYESRIFEPFESNKSELHKSGWRSILCRSWSQYLSQQNWIYLDLLLIWPQLSWILLLQAASNAANASLTRFDSRWNKNSCRWPGFQILPRIRSYSSLQVWRQNCQSRIRQHSAYHMHCSTRRHDWHRFTVRSKLEWRWLDKLWIHIQLLQRARVLLYFNWWRTCTRWYLSLHKRKEFP